MDMGTRITVRLPESVNKQIEEEAKRTGQGVATVVRAYLMKAIESGQLNAEELLSGVGR